MADAMGDKRLAELRAQATDGYAVLGSTLAEVLAEVDRLRATVARVEAWAVQWPRQWQPSWMKPETFDQGVGAAAQDVLAAIRGDDEDEQDDAQQRSEQAEEQQLVDGLTEVQRDYFEILESLDEGGRMRFRIAQAKRDLRAKNEAGRG